MVVEIVLITQLFAALLVMMGYVADIAALYYVAAFLVCTIVLLPKVVVWVVIIGGTIVSGLVELYLPGFEQVRWIFSILSFALGFYCFIASGFKSKWQEGAAIQRLIVVFIFYSLAITIINDSSIQTKLMGVKNYFQIIGLAFGLVSMFDYKSDIKHLFEYLKFLALIQLPFAVHQLLFLAPMRVSREAAEKQIVAVDIVAGTFGGSMDGGGRSNVSALLSIFAVSALLVAWRDNQKRFATMLFCSIIVFLPCILGEAKLAIFILPVAVLYIFRVALREKPYIAIFGLLVIFAIIPILAQIFSLLPGAESQRGESLGESVENMIDYNFGDVGYGNAELNRFKVYGFWIHEHIDAGDFGGALFGHGLGASNISSATATETLAATTYALQDIGLTGISSILWDVGIVGFSIFIWISITIFRMARNTRKKWAGTYFESMVEIVEISLIAVFISFFHNNFIVFDLSFQVMLAILISIVFALSRASDIYKIRND